MTEETEFKLMSQVIKANGINNRYAEKILDLLVEKNRLNKENFELRNEVNILNTARKDPAPYAFTKEKLKAILRSSYMEGMMQALNGYGYPGFTPASIHTIDSLSSLYAEKQVEKLDKER